jgi:hypothetical protein
MDKSEKKRLRKELEEKELIRKALSKTRTLGEDISFRGVGLLMLQILVLPSFEDGECWDIREIDGQLSAFKSVVNTEERVILPGYFRVELANNTIEDNFCSLRRIEFPLFVKQENTATADGTSYSVRLISGIENAVKLSWSGNPPSEWNGFISIISEFLALLRSMPLNELKV